MTLSFYMLYVFLTPVNFSWQWFLIALVMQFLQFLAYIQRGYPDECDDRNYWKGDE